MKRPYTSNVISQRFFCVLVLIIFLTNSSSAQAPVITYTSPSPYIAGTAVTLSPNTSGGGAVPATIYGTVTTFAGSGITGRSNLTGTAASFNFPSGITIDNSSNVFIADYSNNEIRKITSGAVVSLFAGSLSGTPGSTNSPALFSGPNDISIDPATGNMYVADYTNNRIRKVTSAGVVSYLAGSGAPGRTNATGTSATFNGPYGLAFDATTGNVYVADYANNEIRKITSAGVVTLFAGSVSGSSGRGNGSSASFTAPVSVAVDASGNVYVADQGNNEIRKITTAGVVSLFAGNASGTPGSADGTGAAAFFNQPNGLTFDVAGNLYVTDAGNNSIRMITPAGVVTTIAGNGTASLVNGVGTTATFNAPEGLDIDPVSGNLFVADNANQVIRKIITSGYTISGTLPAGLSFDGTTGIISGTPTTPTAATTYTITAYNKSGSSSATVTLSVLAAPLADYGFSKPIVLNSSQISNGGISSTLTDFPALVYIKDDALITGNACGDKVQFPLGNGGGLTGGTNYDFAFTLSGSSTELNYQVDTYDSIHGILFCWVRIPSLTSTNLPLTFYFGSKNPAHSAAFSANTWASDYKAVYHFNEASTSVPVLDATSSARNAVQANTSVTNDEIHIAANLPIQGGGYSFNGSSSSIIQNTGTNPDITDMFTLSAWVYYNGDATSDNKIISNEINYTQGYKLSVKYGKLETETRYVGGDGVGNLGNGGAVSSQTWHYIQGVFTGGATNGTFINYVDGVAVPSSSMTFRKQRTDIRPGAGDVAQMGIDYLKKTTDPNDNTRATNWYNGYMDEVRISNTVKSPDWIKCEYYNQTKPLLFTNFSGTVLSYKTNAPLLVGALVYTWTGLSGTAPTDQTQQANWDAGDVPVFNGNTKMYIPVVSSGNYPVLTADASIYSLTIANGAQLNLNGHTLNVGCNIYNNTTTGGTGILDASNTASGVNWNGSLSAQYYYGSNVKNTAEIGNMTVNNSSTGTVTITGGPVDIYNILKISKGNLVIDNSNSGLLTLKSNAAQTAAVDTIPSAYKISGIVNVERFLTGGGTLLNRGYRLLSSPVNQVQATAGTVATPNTFGLNYLNQHSYGSQTYAGVYTAGPGSGFSGSNKNPLVYLYNEIRPINNASYTSGKHVGVNSIATSVSGSGAGSTTTSTVTLSDGTTNVSIPVGNGFLMFFVGPSSRTDSKSTTAPLDATTTANGYINQGTIPVDLWYTPTGGVKGNLSYTGSLGAANAGYNMVGNPYPCTIDMSKVITDNPGIDAAYVLSGRTLATQAYIAYTAIGSSSPNPSYAVSGEGMIVHATGAGKTLTFKESEKIPAGQLTGSALIMTTPQPGNNNLPGIQNSLAAVEPQGNVLTGLYMKMEKDSDIYNYCGIYFRKDWSDKYEAGDALDMNGGLAVQMSSLTSDGLLASVNHMPDYTKGVNVKLYANASTDGQYKLKIEGIRNIDTLYDIYLIDHYKKDSLDIRRYGTYLFDITKGETSSFGASRFELSVRPRPLPAYRLLNFTAQKVTGGVQVSWQTEAESNYTGFVLQKQDGSTFSPLYTKQGDGSGIYTYIDPSPVTGANTYRLQQDNIIGAISLSPAITIIYNPAGSTGLMSVYPNPAKASISVSVATMTSAPQTYKANIYNSAGQLMVQRSVSSNSWTQDVTQYTPGTYIIQLKDNSGNLVGKSKFVKTN